jgi:tryptophanase
VFIDVNAFLSHLASERFPAEALAGFIYGTSGIRLSKGPPPAPSQASRGINLLRLAVPARKYLREHLDDVAEAMLYAYAHRSEIRGLQRIEDNTRSKYEPAYFSQL